MEKDHEKNPIATTNHIYVYKYYLLMILSQNAIWTSKKNKQNKIGDEIVQLPLGDENQKFLPFFLF